MGEINNWSPHLYMKMNKLCLIFLGVLAIAAIVSAWDNEEDSSLSEELASSRLVRSADARRRKGRKMAKKGGRKARKGRKGREGRKGRGRERQTGYGTTTEATVSETCFDTTVKSLLMYKDVIANFDKQAKRMGKQNSTKESKSGKKGEFIGAAHKLITAGGGNKSALACAGATDNAGAAQMKNLTDVLNGCEDKIHEACNYTKFDSLVNTTRLLECDATVTAWKTGVNTCLDKWDMGSPVADTCSCFTNDSLAAISAAAKQCKFADEAKAVAAALKTCRNTFSECRKYEDDVAEAISACSSNVDDLKKEVAALSQNADKVKEAQAVVKALAASRKRQTAASSCTEVSQATLELTAMVFEFPASPDILVVSAMIIASSSVVCTADEKLELAAIDLSFEEAISHLDSALEASQSALMTMSGATASPAEIAEVVAATTAVAAETTAPPAAAETTAPPPAETTAPPPAGGITEEMGMLSSLEAELSSIAAASSVGPELSSIMAEVSSVEAAISSSIAAEMSSTDTTSMGPTDTSTGTTDTTSGPTDTTTGPSTTTDDTTTTA